MALAVLLVGICYWLLVSVIDAHFHRLNLLEQLLSPTPYEIYMRLSVLGSFLVLYLYAGRSKAKSVRAQRAAQTDEERYRRIVELSPEGIMVHREGTIVFANPAIASLLCLGGSHELIGKPISEFINRFVHPDFHPEVFHRTHKLLGEEVAAPLLEEKYIRSDGQILYVEVAASSFTLEGKAEVEVIIRDISDRKRLEEELNKADKLEAIGLLAGGIAHDFNNVLTVIFGNVSLARLYNKAGKNTKTTEKLGEIEEAAQKARDLTLQLLTFAKGGSPVKKKVFIDNLVREAAQFASSGSNVRCEIRIENGLSPVEIDEGQVNRVFDNIIINSVQAMPEGGVISICTKNVEISLTDNTTHLNPGRYVEISFTDQGSGIPRMHLAKIFDPYFTTKQEGSGLGLAIAYSIIKKHEGTITVYSEEGKGTRFTVYLPASSPEELIGPQQREGTILGSGKVLLVDDEEGIRKVVGEMLASLGYDVYIAKDGAEGLSLYQSALSAGQPFKLAVIDLTIKGGMGGREAIKKLKEIDPGVKAIVSSGYSNDPVLANYKNFGFCGFVAKPYHLEELSKEVYRVLSKSE